MVQQLLPPSNREAADTIIVITEAGVCSEPAFDVAEQGDYFVAVPAPEVISDVISR